MQPLVEAIQGAGFGFSYHFGRSISRYRNYAWGDITLPSEPLWQRSSLSLDMHDNGLVTSITLKADCIRTVVFKKFEGVVPRILEKLNESLKLFKVRQVNNQQLHEADVAFCAQREEDFKDWQVPPFLSYDVPDRPEWRLWNIRANSAHDLGRYTLDLRKSIFANLNAAQVKAFCTFIKTLSDIE